VSESGRPPAPDPWESVPGSAVPPPSPQVPPGYGGFPPPYYPAGFQPARTDGLAIAALVCGLCGFLCFVPGIFGVIFGIVALRRIDRDRIEGKGLAIAGIATGAVWTALLLFVVVSLVVAVN
jgi:peptidyl-prolyl cis-trans isomerase B (cyclophilin B)